MAQNHIIRLGNNSSNFFLHWIPENSRSRLPCDGITLEFKFKAFVHTNFKKYDAKISKIEVYVKYIYSVMSPKHYSE